MPPPGSRERSRPPRVLFLGRIHPVKGLDRLVPALSLVEAALGEGAVEAVLAGPDEGGERARLERLAATCTPRPRIVWAGPVHGAEKARLLAEAAVLVLPSRSESFGAVVLEALAAGTPVVTTRACPWRDVEEAGAGAWVEGTPAALAEALIGILRDPARREAMGRAGRELARRYAWSSCAARMLALYAEAAGRSGRAPSGRGRPA